MFFFLRLGSLAFSFALLFLERFEKLFESGEVLDSMEEDQLSLLFFFSL